jgi:hypothetical protein
MNLSAIAKLVGILALTGSLPVHCADKGPTDLLADKADAVVVGEVQSGQQTGNSAAFVLSIVRTIKGDLAAGDTINVSGTTGGQVNRTLQGDYGLWFLRKSAAQWTFLSTSLSLGEGFLEGAGYLPLVKTISPLSVNTAMPPSTASDQMAVELVAAMQGYTSQSQLSALTREFLGLGESALLPDLYHSLRASPNQELRFIGVRALLWGDEAPSALAEIANNLDLVADLRANFFVVPAVCGIRNPDPGAVQSLGKITSSADVAMGRCAATALMYIHTKATLPFLAQLLGSGDAQTRESAMRGLSRFVDNLPITTQDNTINATALVPQGPSIYRTADTDKYSLSTTSLSHARYSEAAYLQFWGAWWASVKDALSGQSR